MASIAKKVKKGRTYYYAVESARVEGKPRIVWQKYLGTIDAIVERAEKAKPPRPKETVIFEAGGVAALLRIGERLKVMELINKAVPKREQGPSVGHYLLLAAINRALSPRSKVEIGDWYEETVLRRLWRFPKSSFSSQRFWDHMDMVSGKAIERIQEELALRIKKEFGIDEQTLLYDTTNFFTFLATSNDRCDLAQRGHSKAKRHDLRQVGLALLVTGKYQVPLFHRVYPGNLPDVSIFPQLAKELIGRYHKILKTSAEATLVFDKGNLSDEAMERIVVSGQHFVAAVTANRVPHLLSAPLTQFEELPGLPGTKAFAQEETFWGKQSLFVVSYTESFFTQQLNGVTHNLVKCQKKLLDLEKGLIKWRAGKARGQRPTVRGVKASANRILSPQFMKDLFEIKVEQEKGLPFLQYALKHDELDRLSNQRLGRTVLVTDHTDWNSKKAISSYRSLTQIEDAFKNMKNVDFLRWQPAYHWTDQKLKVHGFYCVLALLLATLARKVAIQAGIELSLPELLKELSAIREVAVIYPQGTLAHRKDHITLSRMSPRQRKLAQCLEIAPVLGG
jgi:transposase